MDRHRARALFSAPRKVARVARWRFLAAGLLLMLVAGIGAPSANAMSIRELRALEASDKDQGAAYVQYYLIGAMEGMLEASAYSARSGAKPAICLNGRCLEPRMATPLYDGELRRDANLYEADMPVQLVLLNAMVTAYAC